jgi:phosphatidate cytidylyltransferase
MLVKRVIVALVLIPLFLLINAAGGWAFTSLCAVAIGLAAWEYWRMFTSAGHQPSAVVLIGGVVLLVAARHQGDINLSEMLLAGLAMAAMAVHTFFYERGREQAATDMVITLAGLLYFVWLGGYVISIRDMPGGLYKIWLVFISIWLSDIGGYAIGLWIGRHKIAPRTSPHKSWEGYLGGIVFSVLGTGLAAVLLGLVAPGLTFQAGALFGLVISIFPPIGDFGESMVKRQLGVKDSSNLLPGHGGAWDRMDSWIWSWVIGYYLIAVLFV